MYHIIIYTYRYSPCRELYIGLLVVTVPVVTLFLEGDNQTNLLIFHNMSSSVQFGLVQVQ